MTVYLSILPDRVEAKFPSPPGMDLEWAEEVFPGEVWCGHPYYSLRALGDGRHEIEDLTADADGTPDTPGA